MEIINRSQWRGRGGFSPLFPILRNPAPEPFVYLIVYKLIIPHYPIFCQIFSEKFDIRLGIGYNYSQVYNYLETSIFGFPLDIEAGWLISLALSTQRVFRFYYK